MSAQTEALQRNFVKPLVSAGLGAVMVDMEGLGGFTIDTDIPGLNQLNGTTLGPRMFGAILGFGSTFIVESINNAIHAIDKKNRTKHLKSFVIHSAGSMITWATLPMLMGDVGRGQAQTLAKVGFLTEMFSQWVHENFVEDGVAQEVFDLL